MSPELKKKYLHLLQSRENYKFLGIMNTAQLNYKQRQAQSVEYEELRIALTIEELDYEKAVMIEIQGGVK